MTDEWSGLADFLANMIEKYAVELGIDTLPAPAVDKDGRISEKGSHIRENIIETRKAA